jgi:CheY-like chemotaxis protein
VTPSVLVFVVEDQDAVLDVLEEALVDGGFTIAAASSGEDAIAMLDEEGAGYSALITDIRLPGRVSGWDVARRAREINEKLPVIYITADSGHEWASKGVPNSQLILKPFAIAQVVTAVSHLINTAAMD